MGTSPEFTVIEIQKFLRVTLEGKIDLLASREALLQLAAATTPGHGENILVDGRQAPTDMTPTEMEAVAREFVELEIGVNRKTALLTDPARIEEARFLAMSGKNLGANVQAFDNFDDACAWLSS